jgi:hypothetical protein
MQRHNGCTAAAAAAAAGCWSEVCEVGMWLGHCAGGFKLWEGAVDLCNYLIQQHTLQASSSTCSSTDTSLKVSGRLAAGGVMQSSTAWCSAASALVWGLSLALHCKDTSSSSCCCLSLPRPEDGQLEVVRIAAQRQLVSVNLVAADVTVVGRIMTCSTCRADASRSAACDC